MSVAVERCQLTVFCGGVDFVTSVIGGEVMGIAVGIGEEKQLERQPMHDQNSNSAFTFYAEPLMQLERQPDA